MNWSDNMKYTDDGRAFVLRISDDPKAEQKALLEHYKNRHKGLYPCKECEAKK